MDAAADAFSQATGSGFAVAGACALLGAVAVRRRLPARDVVAARLPLGTSRPQEAV